MNAAREHITQLNLLINELNGIYHAAAVRAGLSDCAFQILYLLYESKRVYKQREMADSLTLAPQTVNSALKKMEKEGTAELKRMEGKMGKSVYLTEKGKVVAKEIIGPVRRAEERACGRLSEKDREAFYRLFRAVVDHVGEELSSVMCDDGRCEDV